MSEISFDYPFPISSADPCDANDCPTPSDDCLICGYEPSNCPPGFGCSDLFGDIKFLNGYIAGFNARLGFGGSDSTLSAELIFAKK